MSIVLCYLSCMWFGYQWQLHSLLPGTCGCVIMITREMSASGRTSKQEPHVLIQCSCAAAAGWEIQNSTKTDRNLFFASKNLLQLEAQLDAGDAGEELVGAADMLVTWPCYVCLGQHKEAMLLQLEAQLDAGDAGG